MVRGKPDADALASLTGGGEGKLRKAPPVSPVDAVAAAVAPVSVTMVSAAEQSPPVTLAPAKKKVGYYAPEADTNRARAAWMRTNPDLGHGSFSDFIAAAVREKTERLEAERNGGRPWPPVGAGVAPTGRPVRQ